LCGRIDGTRWACASSSLSLLHGSQNFKGARFYMCCAVRSCPELRWKWSCLGSAFSLLPSQEWVAPHRLLILLVSLLTWVRGKGDNKITTFLFTLLQKHMC
jgi:hypothetical protein